MARQIIDIGIIPENGVGITLREFSERMNELMFEMDNKRVKIRCPNCGATKIETDICEYCGT